MAGGFGVGPVESIFQNLLAVEQPLELVVVAGRNEELLLRLQQIPVPERHRAKVFGYTSDMDELMTAADVVISKPGGLTTSEALACGTAMIVVNPIPGQESRNSDFLLENGAAVKINNLSTLTYKLGRLLSEPGHLARLRENALRLAKPDAAFTVARAALNWRSDSEQHVS
jgi:processive 1,2-diacylglycerol beta-glucosyltransferase